MTVEERVVQHGLGTATTGKEHGDGVVTFAVKRRKTINQHSQHGSAQGQLGIHIAQFAEHLFKGVHHPGEIEGNETAKDTQQYSCGDTLHGEGVVEHKVEHGLRACPGVGDAGGGQATYQQGEQGSHGQIDHQHFERKHQSGNRGFENTGHST